MGVALFQSAYIVPIIRDGMEEKAVNRSIIARWHYHCEAYGDATGGEVDLGADLIGAIGMFGRAMLWDVQWVSALYTPTDAGMVMYWIINGAEITTMNVSLRQYGQYRTLTAATMRTGYEFPNLWKFRLITAPGAAGTVYNPGVINKFLVNNNGTLYIGRGGGYIYDERFI